MDYELPKSLKRYSFLCPEINTFVNFNKCTTCCMKSKAENNKICWENKLREELISDCDHINMQNIEDHVKCPTCKQDYLIDCAFDNFLCGNCGANLYLDKKTQKKYLGKIYQEIDNAALDIMFSKIKIATTPKQINNNIPYIREPKIGRNEQCPCGSGKKYKHCCGQ